MKDAVLIAMLTGQPINEAPLYAPLPGPSAQNVKATAFQPEGLFLEGNFEKVIYMNPNGSKRRKPFIVGPELPPEYRGPGFVPTVQQSLFGETITPAGGICMPPRLLNGFELALQGKLDTLPKSVSGEPRDEIFDAISSYRDYMKQDNYDRKVEHLMTQGYSKEEVDEAMAAKRKEHLATEIAKPTPVAKMTIKNALETLVKRDYRREVDIEENPTILMA
jgi:hypothetical protein